jgi:phosphoenolpyruvate-protein kinase (PTS system EI component)
MADGEAVHLLASVRHVATALKAQQLGAGAIGLVRSEFLMPEDGRLPDKEFFYHAFGDICEAASSLTVTFRLLDVAADKTPAWLPRLEASGQSLGLQGVRLYSHAPVDRVIDAQLNALKVLAQEYSLRVLLPFLVRIEEYDNWLEKVRAYLPEQIPVGAMAETPAIVLDMKHLLAHADFVSIGCNDLMQTLFAADRDQPEVSRYLDPYAPVLYRLFRQIADQAGENLHRIQLCGVLPQIQGVMPVLLGLGYRHFSVDAPFIPYLAQQVSKTTRTQSRALAQQVCSADTTQQVLDILQLEGEQPAPFLF